MTDQLERELRGIFETDARGAPGVVDVARAVAEGGSQRTRARVRAAVAAIVGGGAAAVGALGVATFAPAAGEPGPIPDAVDVPRLVEPGPCHDSALCAFGFTVDERWYTVSCGAVDPDLVTDELIAVGRLVGEDTEVRVIDGVDPNVMVAIRLDWCQDGGEATTSDWSMVFPDPMPDETTTHEAVCAATLWSRRGAEGCTPTEPDPPSEWGMADWRVVTPPLDDAVVVEIMVTELACASGQPADGRIRVDVSYGADTIGFDVRVIPREGAQDCPGNPDTPYLVPLDEPVGDRVIVSASADSSG